MIIHEVFIEADLIYDEQALGTITTQIPIENGDKTVLDISLDSTLVLKGDGSAFGTFLQVFTTEQSLIISLEGNVGTIATLPGGINVTLQRLPMKNDASLIALAGLNQITINTIDISGGYNNGIFIDLSLTLFNPSSAVVKFSSITLDMFYQNVYVGNATLSNAVLQRGNSILQATAVYSHPQQNLTLGKQFLSNFLNRQTQAVVLRGGKPTIQIMSKALAALESNVDFPGLDIKLIKAARLVVTIPIKSSVRMVNPWSTDISIETAQLQVRVTSDQAYIANINHIFENGNGWVVPKTTNPSMLSNSVSQDVSISLTGFSFGVFDRVDMQGDLEVSIPNDETGFRTEIFYFQNGIETCTICLQPANPDTW